jgi:hypothetical protein
MSHKITNRVHITNEQLIRVLAVDDVKKSPWGQLYTHKNLGNLHTRDTDEESFPPRPAVLCNERIFPQVLGHEKDWTRSIIDLSLPGIPLVMTGVAKMRQSISLNLGYNCDHLFSHRTDEGKNEDILLDYCFDRSNHE